MEPDVLNEVCAKADAARIAQAQLAQTNTQRKNELLNAIADALDARANEIAEANAIDMQKSAEHGMDAGKLDRLKFDVPRVNAAAQGVRHVATLQDPIGEIVRGYHLDNGLRLEQTRVPIGVLGMIYEARPNVTVDVASLCIKSGNAALLRGGHAAERTNAATLNIIADVLHEHGYDAALIASVDEYGRQGANAMMQAQGHIDLLIPRGGAGLIQAVVQNSKVPVIETGAGNVHIYVDRTGDQNKAIPIILNAKTQRVGVCNATEKLLVHSDIAEAFLPQIATALATADVEVHADEQAYKIIDKTGDLVGAKLVDNERKIMLITNEGIIIKMAVSDISIIGRNTSGVKLMSIDAESGIAVASIAKVRESDKDEDEEDEFLEEQDREETESENTEDVMAEL